MSAEARPLGGPIWTKPFRVMTLFAAIAGVLAIWRYAAGIGPVAGINDGHPWGIWIAFDVVTGTALGCGGVAMALLVYVFNRNRLHPLIRPALLTSAIGYTLAVVAVGIDVGKPWGLPKLPLMPWRWNLSSAQLEVALCVAVYVVVLWVELAPAFLERWKDSSKPWLRNLSTKVLPPLRKSMVWVIAAGVVLPFMHQSSLGTMTLLGGWKLHRLWHTPLIPLLFLLGCLGMGYAAVVFESSLASLFFRRKPEIGMLAQLAGPLAGVMLLFLAIRFGDLAYRGRLGMLTGEGTYSVMFWIETALFLVPAVMLLMKSKLHDLAWLFRAAVLMLFGGALYRFDAYIIAFNPGPGWSYFPTVPEIFITLGLVALSFMVYLVVVKRFPILSGEAPAATRG
ncbi:MAG: Ni/Fe-hydrogenase cytochrome b subunit [Acidobacteriota bacterium]|jgi:Ni/Fe-hydrogenase subunit HybB-like protein